jgi:hypothetical protein
VTGLWCGLIQVLNATSHLAVALRAAQSGDFADLEKHIDSALVEMTYASKRAKAVYERVQERAVRTNKRGTRRPSRDGV